MHDRVGLVAAIVLLAPGCGPSGPTAPYRQHGGTAARGGPPADATLAYWNGLSTVPAQLAPALKGPPAVQVEYLRDGARVIRGNPTLGVDPDLVAWALRAADLFDRQADLVAYARSPAAVVEAFARGWSGDPFGVAVEVTQAERAVLATTREHARSWAGLRATLTARYGVQFP